MRAASYKIDSKPRVQNAHNRHRRHFNPGLTPAVRPGISCNLPAPGWLASRLPKDAGMFEQTFKNIDDILHKDAGCASELDYTE